MAKDQSGAHFEAIRASAADERRAADRALERAGLTEVELREQAARNDFESLSARLAWVIVSGLKDPQSETTDRTKE